MASSCEVDGALLLLLRGTRALGLAPVTLRPEGRSVRAAVRPVYMLHGVILALLLTVVNVYGGALLMNIYLNKNLHWFVTCFNVSMSTLGVIVSVLSGPARMRFLFTCLNQLREIKEEIGFGNTHELEEKVAMIVVLCSIPVAFCLTTVYNIIDLVDSQGYITMNDIVKMLCPCASANICSTIKFCVQLEQTLLLILLNGVFRNINKCLENIEGQLEGSFTGNVRRTTSIRQEVRKLSMTFCTTVELMRKLIKYEQYILTLLYIPTVFFILLTVWNLRAALSMEVPWARVMNLVIELLWTVYHAIGIAFIVEPCHRIQQSTEETKSRLSELLCLDLGWDGLQKEVVKFLDQFLVPIPPFTLLGISPISRPFVFKTMSLVMTLLSLASSFNIEKHE